MAMQTVSFRTPSEVVAALDALALRQRTDRTNVLNHAIAAYLASEGSQAAPQRVLGRMAGPAVPADFDTRDADAVRVMFEGSE